MVLFISCLEGKRGACHWLICMHSWCSLHYPPQHTIWIMVPSGMLICWHCGDAAAAAAGSKCWLLCSQSSNSLKCMTIVLWFIMSCLLKWKVHEILVTQQRWQRWLWWSWSWWYIYCISQGKGCTTLWRIHKQIRKIFKYSSFSAVLLEFPQANICCFSTKSTYILYLHSIYVFLYMHIYIYAFTNSFK